MEADRPKDLRVLATELVKLAVVRWPDQFRADDVKRVSGASNVLLVVLRVLAGAMVRSGVPREDLTAAAQSAVHRPDTGSSYEAMSGERSDEVKITTGRMDPMVAMGEVDKALVDPSCAGRVWTWFRDDIYPGIVKRAARGDWPSEREVEVMLAAVGHMRGDR